MILDLVKMLQSAGIGMMDGSVLGPKEGYEQASSITFGMTLGLMAESLDGAAEGLHEENAALRALFAEAATGVGDPGLEARLREAAADTDASLRLSVLREANQALSVLLIDLHARVEEIGGEEARDLEERIWRELVRSTERRRLALAPF